jgi:hypothetical protein
MKRAEPRCWKMNTQWRHRRYHGDRLSNRVIAESATIAAPFESITLSGISIGKKNSESIIRMLSLLIFMRHRKRVLNARISSSVRSIGAT